MEEPEKKGLKKPEGCSNLYVVLKVRDNETGNCHCEEAADSFFAYRKISHKKDLLYYNRKME